MLYLCFLLFCPAFITRSRGSEVISLPKITIAPADTNKVLKYIKLFDKYSEKNDFDSCLMTSRYAYNLSARLNYVHGMVLSTIRNGVAYEVLKKDYPQAIRYYRQAIEIAESR